MIVSGYTEMKRFLPAVEMKGQPVIFDDALEVAQDRLAADILGDVLTQTLEERQREDRQLFRLVQRAIALEAFLSCIPELDLVLTDAGFGVVSNQDFAPASRERVAALTESLSAKLDESKDRLVSFLLASTVYEDWRGTEQFARLSDSLILTLAEFRDVAVYNPVTAPAYPKGWSDFLRLNAALSVALSSDVASYISPEYAAEIVEKIRDRETFLPSEKKALQFIKTATAAYALGDRETGLNQAVKAATFMRANIADFPTFAGSSAALDISLTHEDTPIYSMF